MLTLFLPRAISTQTAYAYIPSYGDNTVSLINTMTDKLVATVPVGGGPVGVAITPDGAKVYITNSRGQSISVISSALNVVTSTIANDYKVFPAPVAYIQELSGIAVSPNGARAYAARAAKVGANQVYSAGLFSIDTSTETLVAFTPLQTSGGCLPEGVAITPMAAGHTLLTVAAMPSLL